MTWTAIADADLDPGEPWTSLKALALRDNFAAMAAGDTGAPKIIGKALDLWLATLTLNGTTAVGVSDLDGYAAIRIELSEAGTPSGGVASIQARFSDDNGSTWGSFQAITGAMAANAGYAGSIIMSLTTGRFTSFLACAGISGSTIVPTNPHATGTLTVPSGCNAFQLRYASARSSGKAEIFGFGTFD